MGSALNDLPLLLAAARKAAQEEVAKVETDLTRPLRYMAGPPGKDGTNGRDGMAGPQGRAGDRGERGPQGPKGIRGDIGPQGPEGKQGQRGPQGSPGIDGRSGIDGNGVLAVALNGADLIVTMDNGTIINLGPVKGERGPRGPRGPSGSGGGAGGGSAAWGGITGVLSAQTDLQAALNAKEGTITAGTTAQYFRGDKTFQTLDKSAVGLANVDNTSDANKPVSTATQTALNAKEGTITAGTTAQYWRGDKSFQTLDKTAVGLANVDNTSDASKPVSTATQTALNAKQDTLVSATNIKTINGSSVLGAGNLTVSASAAGSTGQVQYNSAGALAGAANFSVENAALRMVAQSTPSTPAAGGLNLYGKTFGGRTIPAFIGPAGIEFPLQAHFGFAKPLIQYAATSTTLTTLGCAAQTAVGTATAATIATTSLHQLSRRLEDRKSVV